MTAPVAFVDDGLGNSSYLVDLGDRRALVIDPTRHPGGYLGEGERRGLEVAYSVETHLHADFVSGSRELAALGAQVIAPRAAGLEFPAHGLADGDEVDLGGLRLQGLATPGHTPEHLSYLLLDGATPVALFSGGSLLVGAVARTDLIDPTHTDELARQLWRSLQGRILVLPDDLPVYPTHGAGSFCAAPAGGERVTTIGREKRTNPLLAAPSEDAFVERLMAGLGSYPPYFLRLREVNRRGPTVYGPGPGELPALSVAAVEHVRGDGGYVIDARSIDRFAAGHVPGAISIALRDSFATWLGWLVPEDVPLVFVVDTDQDVALLVREARKVGYERLAGSLAGGVDAWLSAGRALGHVEMVDAAAAQGLIVDVRQQSEFDVSHIPGAVHVELGAIAMGRPDIPSGPISVMCSHGERAMSAASLLAAAGRRKVRVLTGGPDRWAAAHRVALASR
jgi:glyoxylase-like metal-dependent hydrolase (beta-lactamase superfamily II)/rhodanese-related sulfurtransferase